MIRILCVDDEPMVLEGLALHLRRRCEVATANGGEEGLRALRTQGPFAAVISDMRMPGMDGAEFLRRALEEFPDVVRLLLTGYADVDSAVAAVNDGRIFRFLTKPCSPDTLQKAVAAAAEQHRLVTAERVLLAQTLMGSIKALLDVLTLLRPMAFARASRVKRVVSEVAAKAGVKDRWQVEIAAMLSQVGAVTLPAETLGRLYYGKTLDPAEEAMAANLPNVVDQLLANIPRLEPVREILRQIGMRYDGRDAPGEALAGQRLTVGARLLTIALDFDVLEAQGQPPETAMRTLLGRTGRYDPQLLAAFGAEQAAVGKRTDVVEIALRDLRVGMIFAEDVRNVGGRLLIARGFEVTPTLLQAIRNYPQNSVKDLVRVYGSGAKKDERHAA